MKERILYHIFTEWKYIIRQRRISYRTGDISLKNALHYGTIQLDKLEFVKLLDQLEFGEVHMKIEKCTKDAFVVIGKEGSTLDGQGFIQKLWTDANSHFSEVQPFAKKDENGNLVGIWGAMSDCSHSYKPWEENFSKGLYLAGVECVDDAEAPEGWTKWKIPGYEYLYAEVESESTFSIVLDYMNTNNIVLAGAVHDFTCPLDGKNYMFFPIRTI